MDKLRLNLLLKLYIIFFSIFAFLELVFRVSIIGFLQSENLFRIFLFVGSYAMIIVFILRLLPRKMIKYVAFILIFLISGFYFSQDLYYRMLSGFYSFSIVGDAKAGFGFLDSVFKNMSWLHLLYIPPIALGIHYFFKPKNKEIHKRILFFSSKSDFALSVLATFSLFFITVSTIPKINLDLIDSPYAYSDYDLYKENPSAYQTIDKFGVLTYLQRDIAGSFKSRDDDGMIKAEIQAYLNSQVIHQQNEYSDYFKDKNFIMIMAESFDTYAIDPTLTPNIYKMQQNSWNFEQYYSPLYYRNTADTEFMSQTSFFAHKNVVLTMESFKDNEFPNTLPKLFNHESYRSYSFHDYTDFFYPRSVFHPLTLGYNEYYGAIELDMIDEQEERGPKHQWPSDLDLVNKTMDILVEKQQPFFSYILTVSGHLPYTDDHPIALKNYDLVKQIFIDEQREMPVDDILYYHAANYELDLAIGALLERLDEANMADDTVIMLYGDHYAYGLDKDIIESYDDTKTEDDFLGMQRVPMMIYHPSLVHENKKEVFSSIDITPTLANLFGLELDYSQVLGVDIFSNQNRSVLFSNGSILTDHFIYNLEKDEIIFFEEMNYDLVKALISEYTYKKRISQLLLDIDYFKEVVIE